MKKFLVSLGCGLSFVFGTSIIALQTLLALLAGFVLYLIGFTLMHYYRNLK